MTDHRPIGMDPKLLLPGEEVTSHWGAPRGVAVLTTKRILLLGHPHPFHRNLEWESPLEKLASIEVVQLGSVETAYPALASQSSRMYANNTMLGDTLEGSFAVRVDGVDVHRGTPLTCEEIQRKIDLACPR